MTPGLKKIVLLAILAVVVFLANARSVVEWLDQAGVIVWAQHVRSEYVTGTAITVILAMLFLLGGPPIIARCARIFRRCPVCGQKSLSEGRYCGACGRRSPHG
ncbi:MAG: hypothetical protein IPK83_17150 [Planctomycetes bacterium]|nr:hypothetical protein [Planctomycetota bacterium]